MRQYSTYYNNKLQKILFKSERAFSKYFKLFKELLYKNYSTNKFLTVQTCTLKWTLLHISNLKKSCFFGTKKSKNRYLEKYKYHIEKKYVSFFIVYRTREKIFSAIKNLVISLTWNHPYVMYFTEIFSLIWRKNCFRSMLWNWINYLNFFQYCIWIKNIRCTNKFPRFDKIWRHQ